MSFRQIILVLLVFFISACGDKTTSTTVSPKGAEEIQPVEDIYPKNIILMIGDGMGIAQISAAMYLNSGKLNIENFPVIGLQKTYSGDNLITDSAAGATAIACGVKTYNNAIGVDMDTLPVPSIMTIAKENGLATGIVVTSSVVHGTPSPFVSHVVHRQFKEKIALDFMNTDIDFLVGGGKKYFDNRRDEKNLYKEFKNQGYFISDYFKQDIFEMHISSRRKFVFFTSNDDPIPASAGRKYLPYVSSIGAKFLRKRSDKGFFMMIEGSQIDWGGHAKDAEKVVSELMDFDKAIGKILRFAKKDKETLVIVTADHECGGFAINNGSTREVLFPAFTTNGHTADLIPVFAYGPKAELFRGIYENTDIFKKMKQALRLDKKEN